MPKRFCIHCQGEFVDNHWLARRKSNGRIYLECKVQRAGARRRSYERNMLREQNRSRNQRLFLSDKRREWKKRWDEENRPRKHFHDNKRRASKLRRTPLWINLEAVMKFYDLCPSGYHVDHIVPLQGRLVSGLHVLENLQYLPGIENISKGNRVDLDLIQGWPHCRFPRTGLKNGL